MTPNEIGVSRPPVSHALIVVFVLETTFADIRAQNSKMTASNYIQRRISRV